MTNDEILEKFKERDFTINQGLLLWNLLVSNRNNSYYLEEILKQQIEIKELLKGNTEEVAQTNINEKLDELILKFNEYLKEDMIDDLNNLSTNE